MSVWLGAPGDGPLTWDVVVRRVLWYALMVVLASIVVRAELGQWRPVGGPVTLALLGATAAGTVLASVVSRLRPDRLPAVLLPLAVLAVPLGVVSVDGSGVMFLLPAATIAGTRWSLPRSLAFVAGSAAVFEVGYRLAHGHLPTVWLPIVVTGSYLSSLLDRAYHERVRQTGLLLAQTERARAAEARSATLAERTRIAREMHDVLAHSLAGLAVQLEAADVLLGTGQHDVARDVVRRSRRLAREGLAEVKQAVLALREGGGEPLPRSLRGLVTASGLPATCAVAGTERDLASDASFALYRIAQEALTNAAKHAPGTPVRLCLDYTPGHVELIVRNALPAGPTTAAGAGYGVTGMAERVEPLGGSLTAGPVDGHWQVAARIPG